ncbi:MAG: tetratricopeptide repeat protein [Polyangiaceae bacterium]|nr:tetratricopeptide repeat protein [Polyangiaceae bacterium]
MTRAFRCLLITATLALASPAFGQDRVELEKARAAYLARNYADAEERLGALVDPQHGLREPGLLSQARMYLAATLLADGKRDAALDMLDKLIVEDPSFEPDPLSFPSDVINTFIDVRAGLQERLREAARNAARLEAEKKAKAERERVQHEAWIERVKEMAREDKTTVRNLRLVAFVPLGAGQFQNRQPALGWLFFSTEAALVVATAVTIPMYSYAIGRRDDELRSGDIEQKAGIYSDRARTIRIVNLGLVGGLVALAAAGIVQANVAFVAEREETQRRPLPALSHLVPTLSPIGRDDGGLAGITVGLSGTVF